MAHEGRVGDEAPACDKTKPAPSGVPGALPQYKVDSTAGRERNMETKTYVWSHPGKCKSMRQQKSMKIDRQ